MQNRGAPGPDDNRNMFLAVILMIAILGGFELFYNGPQRERALAAQRAEVQAVEQAGEPGGAAQPERPVLVERDRALSETADTRVVIDSASVDGSLTLEGARIDDLNLRTYRETIDPNSPEVTLLAPIRARHGHDAVFGWESRDLARGGESVLTLADAFSAWTAQAGARLTPDTPVTLTLAAGDGLTISRTISLDQDYMFTITDTLKNDGASAHAVRPFGVVRSQGLPADYKRQSVVHQGMTGVFGPQPRLHETRFEDAAKHARRKAEGRINADERIVDLNGPGGWLGITDHYWMAAIIPDQDETLNAYYNASSLAGETDFRAAYRGDWRDLPAGGSVTYTQRLFAGAKRVDLIRAYQREFDIPDFDKAIDWGMFFFLTRPFFAMLDFLGKFIGNFGLGILLSTVVIKALLFPLVYHSFKSMAKMRALQPKMKEIQERYAADKTRMQQEQMKLLSTEKVNPISGCVPILFQIPVFFALYKVLSVTIEMRHAPFFGWIHDLSAPDPSSIFNLFGLLPAIGFDFHAIPILGLAPAIGVWPILYGVSMWALQALSPPPTDPVQAKIFQFLPIVFTIMFAGFAAGMVIYWTWSNTLSILQQYVIMRRQGVETQLDAFLAKRRQASAEGAGR